jgi:hypothetical protein
MLQALDLTSGIKKSAKQTHPFTIHKERRMQYDQINLEKT